MRRVLVPVSPESPWQGPQKQGPLKAAVALHFAHYNFVRIHKTLRVTPAMEAGVTNRLWSISDLLREAN
jgi:hypothetical protein